ncbi:MAG: 2'-5' RNA ligase family protein [Hydrogenophaga sp.]|uniref:2'-5' RNA ligase family protein n=1 Tax=Hydrogenophaga sp. TaxID=1904254 RepID=UPI00271A5569|nr:2'-5' RNA ligase family protein [Hydrogenophaga sp.]MDO9146684.1 2'-5' RNA ligase family protein [Hydrogenophaga sp.]MDO9603504.1 2'-5' RNA ligase family protein [Hydrogenophaga sp.]
MPSKVDPVEPPAAVFRPTDRLFFGVFPDAATAERTASHAQYLRQALGLTGHVVAADRLHLTWHHLGDFVGLPQVSIDAACEAASRTKGARFALTFDRIASLGHRAQRKRPVVLLPGVVPSALSDLWCALGQHLDAHTWPTRRVHGFTPHVTLLYDRQRVIAQPVEPLVWDITAFVLVRSLLGQTQHQHLGRWLLEN